MANKLYTEDQRGRIQGLAKNLIINGDFNLWQRGTSFVSAASSAYTTDRFITYKSGSMVYDITRSTDVPTTEQSGHKSNFSYKLAVTTGDASIAAGDFTMVRQKIEGYNIAQVMGRTLVLSFWVKATVTGTYCIGFSNSIADRSFIREYTIDTTNTWEKKYVTITMTETGGSWDYTSGIGLNINWIMACGSTYHTTADAWQTGTYLSTSNQVNGVGSASDIFELSQIQFEVGETPTEFEYRPLEEEVSLCQRYYQVITIAAGGYFAAAMSLIGQSDYIVAMRGTPTTVEVNGAYYGNVNCGTTSSIIKNSIGIVAYRATLGAGFAQFSSVIRCDTEL